MYLEEIKCKKNGKVYTTRLIRESFRENGKVKHRTLCNVSKLPKKQLLDLKKSLSGSSGDFSIADLSIGKTYEYGASFALKSLATQIGLDKAIFSTKTQWREDAMAMICGRIIHQGSKESDFKIITALTHGELKKLIEKEKLQMELFDQSNITEIVDSENGEMLCMLCKNDFEMKKETQTRQKMIEKVSDLFATKAAVKRKRDPQKVCASIGRIFEKCKIEKFFSWNVGENGELTWELKHDIIEQEQKLDGCYVIKTDAQKDVLRKETTVETYRNLQKIEQSFKNMPSKQVYLSQILNNNRY